MFKAKARKFIEQNNLNSIAKVTDDGAVDLTGYTSPIVIKRLLGTESLGVPVIFPGNAIVHIQPKLSSFDNMSVAGVMLSLEVELRAKTLAGCPQLVQLKLASCDGLLSFEGAPPTLVNLVANFATNLKGFKGLPAFVKIIVLDLYNNFDFSFDDVPAHITHLEVKEVKGKSDFKNKVKYPKHVENVGLDALSNIGELMLCPRLKKLYYTGRFADDRHRDALLQLHELIKRTSNPKARYYEAQQMLIDLDLDVFF